MRIETAVITLAHPEMPALLMPSPTMAAVVLAAIVCDGIDNAAVSSCAGVIAAICIVIGVAAAEEFVCAQDFFRRFGV